MYDFFIVSSMKLRIPDVLLILSIIISVYIFASVKILNMTYNAIRFVFFIGSMSFLLSYFIVEKIVGKEGHLKYSLTLTIIIVTIITYFFLK